MPQMGPLPWLGLMVVAISLILIYSSLLSFLYWPFKGEVSKETFTPHQWMW